MLQIPTGIIYKKLRSREKKSLLSENFALNYPLSILVAEDNIMNQKLLLRILAKLGYQPDLAGDGIEALACLNEKYLRCYFDGCTNAQYGWARNYAGN